MIYRRWAFAVITLTARICHTLKVLTANRSDFSKSDRLPPQILYKSLINWQYRTDIWGDLLIRVNKTKEARAGFAIRSRFTSTPPAEIERKPADELEFALDYIRFAYLLATCNSRKRPAACLTKRLAPLSTWAAPTTPLTTSHYWHWFGVGWRRSGLSGSLHSIGKYGGNGRRQRGTRHAALDVRPTSVRERTRRFEQTAEASRSECCGRSNKCAVFHERFWGRSFCTRPRSGSSATQESIAQFPSNQPIGTGTVLLPQLLLAMTRWRRARATRLAGFSTKPRPLDEEKLTQIFVEPLAAPGNTRSAARRGRSPDPSDMTGPAKPRYLAARHQLTLTTDRRTSSLVSQADKTLGARAAPRGRNNVRHFALAGSETSAALLSTSIFPV